MEKDEARGSADSPIVIDSDESCSQSSPVKIVYTWAKVQVSSLVLTSLCERLHRALDCCPLLFANRLVLLDTSLLANKSGQQSKAL